MHARICHMAHMAQSIERNIVLRQKYLTNQTQNAKVHLRRAWRIEFWYKDIRDYWERLKGRARGIAHCPELALLTVPNNLEYLYTKIRFSTPGSGPTTAAAARMPVHACRGPCTHASSSSSMHACMPVHACRSMHASCC